MAKAPIALFVYNRLNHTRQTLEALKKNLYADETELIVLSDGPKNLSDQHPVDEVREYARSITGFKSISVIKEKSNKGLASSIIDGVTNVLSSYRKVIVMEDDLISSSFLLQYMNEALDMYEQDEEVISIHGYQYPIQKKLPETFFIRGADCWSWATWSRGWQYFERDGATLLRKLETRGLSKEFNFNNTYPYKKMLQNQVRGLNQSWAIRWYASAFLQNKFTLYPGRALVHNIGMDSSGTHCETSTALDVTIQKRAIKLEKQAVKENQEARKEMEHFFRSIRYTRIIGRIYKRLKFKR